MHELISTLKKKALAGNKWSNIFPNSSHARKATTSKVKVWHIICDTCHFHVGTTLGRNKVEGTGKEEIKKTEVMAVGEACEVVF